MANNLYKLTTRLEDYWVVAEHPTQAETKLKELLDKNDYGFTSSRKVRTIELIAEGISDERFFGGKFFIE